MDNGTIALIIVVVIVVVVAVVGVLGAILSGIDTSQWFP